MRHRAREVATHPGAARAVAARPVAARPVLARAVLARAVAARALAAVALALTAGAAIAGCAAATATPAATPATTRPAATGTAAPVYGPPSRDAACTAADKAEQTLEARQGKDQNNESALDQDFTNFANALSAAAQQEKHASTAQAMTTLANDYNVLVESQSGAAQLPDMSQVQSDGAAFDKACGA
jgi:hypothetical protein